ncbi:MAG: WS/DGAT/MGAT family O-acyltransferase [Myxococcota bacterium]
MQQLSGLDASFLYFETANAPMHIGSLAIYDQSTVEGGLVTFKSLLANVEQRLHRARCFRQKLVNVPFDLDHPYWIEDDAFDLEYHLRHIALPKPGDWRQLCIQTARLHSRPLDLSRPLWEMTVIEGLDNVPGLPPGSFAVVTKIHHAAIDGVSGAELAAAIHDLTPGAPVPPPEEEWKPERSPSWLELSGRLALNNIRQPFRAARMLGQSLPAVRRWRQEMASRPEPPDDESVPRTRFNGTVSPLRVVEGRRFDLGEVREIKKTVVGATVNDAIITLCGGALRRYLEHHGELPEESLWAMTPVSVRTEDEAGTAGNQVSSMLMSVKSDVADPAERLAAVTAGSQRSKELTKAVGARLMTDASQFIPGSLAGLAARAYSRFGLANRIDPFFNTVITNVPGPQQDLYWNDARLVANYGLGPVMDGMGIIHAVFSYCGEITVTATSCREMMPDPQFYADCLQTSFDELKQATLGPAPV